MKRYRYILFSTALFVFFFRANSQLLDTLKVILKSRSSIDLRLESRYSFIDNELAEITGVRGGVSFRRKLRFGGGFSWLKNDIIHNEYKANENGVLVSSRKYLKLAYIALYADFVFYKTKRWQLSIPIQTGLGASWFQSQKAYNFNSGKKYFLALYEPGIATNFKIFKWFGLGADVGYRFALKNNHYVDYQYSYPTYAFKILFWADQLYYDIFPNSKWAKKFGPAAW